MNLTEDFIRDSDTILNLAVRSLFERLDSLCEGAIAVDSQARIVWINQKYALKLGLTSPEEALGRDVEEVIPNSLLRQVVSTGEPILLDIMEFGDESFVVTRMPLKNESNVVIGAIGFVLYDRLNYLKPLVSKFAKLQSELAKVKKNLVEQRHFKYTLSDFVGSSPACLEVKRQARRAAKQDATVMLLGETGTGKELLAHAIHALSDRADKPFIGVNVAAVPESLLEAEFFGVAPGAFTGAERKGRDGKFKIADGGTLFLDEAGDMPLPLQTKLLRVLEEQEMEPLGSNKVIKIDVRVITATCVDLKRLVNEDRFRTDLYYRLNVLPITVPALRERLSDLEALCEAILGQIADRTGMPHREITSTAIAVLSSYDWPGNVRELRNVLERTVMLTDNVRLSADDFATVLPMATKRRDSGGAPVHTFAESLAEFERSAIRSALDATGGRVTEAAKVLGLSRATLYKKIRALQMNSL
ncbi:MAG: sigma-54 interaction domain-containing protein [Gammaproteobacteria bacterium]